MKLLIYCLLIFVSVRCSAQSICVSVNCKDTVKYPQDTVTLNSIVTSGDGIKSTKWSVTSGVATIDSPFALNTVARKLSSSGVYVFSLTAITNQGATATAFDTVIYIGNKPPKAIVGANFTDTTNTAVLSGSNSTDPEGLPLTYSWIQSSGPNAATINTPTMANPLLSGLVNGTYVFTLTVKDSGGLTSSASQTVTVAIPVTLVKTVTVITKYWSDGTTTVTTTTVP
jgi:hypothetical protein